MKNKVICMPTRREFPLPQHESWKATICMECGQECWDRPVIENVVGAKKMCIDCAIKNEIKQDLIGGFCE